MLKAKHAYGTLEGVDAALEAGTIDAFDVLFLKDADGNPYVGWIDKDGQKNIIQSNTATIVEGESLPEVGETGQIYIFNDEAYVYNGTEYVNISESADLSALEAEIATKVNEEKVQEMIEAYAESAVEIVEF